MKIVGRVAALSLAMRATSGIGSASTDAVVQVPVGKVRGVIVDGQTVFKGIPYAQAPVGELRWKPGCAGPTQLAQPQQKRQLYAFRWQAADR